jgi:hypothetical protein
LLSNEQFGQNQRRVKGDAGFQDGSERHKEVTSTKIRNQCRAVKGLIIASASVSKLRSSGMLILVPFVFSRPVFVELIKEHLDQDNFER